MSISAKIIADSVNPDGKRITTFVCTVNRYVLAEFNTHRSLSRNSASSRAIPVHRMIESVMTDTAIPVRWGKAGSGMQDHGEFKGEECEPLLAAWESLRNAAVAGVQKLLDLGVHKQIANRPLEPFLWHRMLVTATDWENFFHLRCHKDAQPEFQRLAYLMLEAYVETSTPEPLAWGFWHIPFSERMPPDMPITDRLKIAVARAARLSYETMDNVIDFNADFRLYDSLLADGHLSPFEHVARARSGRHANFSGWQAHRCLIPRENRTGDLKALLQSYRESTGMV